MGYQTPCDFEVNGQIVAAHDHARYMGSRLAHAVHTESIPEPGRNTDFLH